jgi:hypothetical protein
MLSSPAYFCYGLADGKKINIHTAEKGTSRKAKACGIAAGSVPTPTDLKTPLRKKLRKYPGLNTPLGIPGVFFGVFPFLVYSCPFLGYSGPEYPKLLRLGYFAWCIPKVTAPTPGTFALK